MEQGSRWPEPSRVRGITGSLEAPRVRRTVRSPRNSDGPVRLRLPTAREATQKKGSGAMTPLPFLERRCSSDDRVAAAFDRDVAASPPSDIEVADEAEARAAL